MERLEFSSCESMRGERSLNDTHKKYQLYHTISLFYSLLFFYLFILSLHQDLHTLLDTHQLFSILNLNILNIWTPYQIFLSYPNKIPGTIYSLG